MVYIYFIELELLLLSTADMLYRQYLKTTILILFVLCSITIQLCHQATGNRCVSIAHVTRLTKTDQNVTSTEIQIMPSINDSFMHCPAASTVWL